MFSDGLVGPRPAGWVVIPGMEAGYVVPYLFGDWSSWWFWFLVRQGSPGRHAAAARRLNCGVHIGHSR